MNEGPVGWQLGPGHVRQAEGLASKSRGALGYEFLSSGSRQLGAWVTIIDRWATEAREGCKSAMAAIHNWLPELDSNQRPND